MADQVSSVEVTGIDSLQKQLQQAIEELDHPHELLDALGARLVAEIERRFLFKDDPDGTPWQPLAPATLKRYAAKDKGKGQGTLLERSGDMLLSLTANTGSDYVEVGMSRLTDGGAWQIPLLHETGTRRMPRRGIFLSDWSAGTLGNDDQAALDDELQNFLDGLFGD